MMRWMLTGLLGGGKCAVKLKFLLASFFLNDQRYVLEGTPHESCVYKRLLT